MFRRHQKVKIVISGLINLTTGCLSLSVILNPTTIQDGGKTKNLEVRSFVPPLAGFRMTVDVMVRLSLTIPSEIEGLSLDEQECLKAVVGTA